MFPLRAGDCEVKSLISFMPMFRFYQTLGQRFSCFFAIRVAVGDCRLSRIVALQSWHPLHWCVVISLVAGIPPAPSTDAKG
jgi:hypothetical protein